MTTLAAIGARLDDLPVNRALFGLIARISSGGWFEAYDLFMLAYISLGMIKSGLFVATGTGPSGIPVFAGAGFAGMFFGTLLFGWVSDRFGRRVAYTSSLAWYSLFTIAMALAPTAFAIDALRFLACVGIGVQLITIDAYVSELSPPAARGKAIAFSQAVVFTAVPAVALLAQWLVPHSWFGLDGWRIVALLGGLGVVTIWPIVRSLPESPRWLAARGRLDEAAKELAHVEAIVGRSWGRTGDEPPHHRPDSLSNVSPAASWLEMWDPAYRTRSLMLVVFNFCQTIGFYGFASWVAILLFSEGVSFVHSLQYVFLIALAAPIGPLIAIRAAEGAERKWQIVSLAAASAGFGLAFAAARAPWLIVCVGLALTLANNWFSCAFHAYQAELYPTRIRAQAVGFVYAWSRLSAVFVGFWIAAILARYGPGAAFAFIAAAMAIAGGIVAAVGPLTRGRRLESLSP
ncbi:MAG TPA: MFS transporter [Candidatus Eremiobacteraceae bacterium]|nr:MFS transporter [Candidatus Eremiobacteraceae bacterium]